MQNKQHRWVATASKKLVKQKVTNITNRREYYQRRYLVFGITVYYSFLWAAASYSFYLVSWMIFDIRPTVIRTHVPDQKRPRTHTVKRNIAVGDVWERSKVSNVFGTAGKMKKNTFKFQPTHVSPGTTDRNYVNKSRTDFTISLDLCVFFPLRPEPGSLYCTIDHQRAMILKGIKCTVR